MIVFNPAKFEIELVEVIALSHSNGGYLRAMDQRPEGERNGSGKVSVPCPRNVISQYVGHHKTSKYIKPVWVACLRYEGEIVALERHPMGAMGARYQQNLMGEMVEWEPQLARALPQLKGATARGTWYTDGQYVYKLDHNTLSESVEAGTKVSSDGKFIAVPAEAIDLSKLIDEDTGRPYTESGLRTCIAYKASNGTIGISPPAWTTLDGVDNKLSAGTLAPSVDDPQQFDKADAALAVNLNFAILAGKDMSATFGYRAIEPLSLPRIMLNLRTVNVPALPKSIKNTFDVGMKFSHAMAWLIGYCERCPDLESYRVVRRLLKYLTGKGNFPRRMFDQDNVFKTGADLQSIPQISVDAARKAADVDIDAVMKLMLASKDTKAHSAARESLVMGAVFGELAED